MAWCRREGKGRRGARRPAQKEKGGHDGPPLEVEAGRAQQPQRDLERCDLDFLLLLLWHFDLCDLDLRDLLPPPPPPPPLRPRPHAP